MKRFKKHWYGRKNDNKGRRKKKEYRYYISSLKEDIDLFSRAMRGHWSVESMHWYLDVTFIVKLIQNRPKNMV